MPSLIQKPSTVGSKSQVSANISNTDESTSEMQTIPSSSLVNWRPPKCDDEGHLLIDFPLKNETKRKQKSKDSDEEYNPSSSIKRNKQTKTSKIAKTEKAISSQKPEEEPEISEAKNAQPDPDGGLDGFCLYCHMPLN